MSAQRTRCFIGCLSLMLLGGQSVFATSVVDISLSHLVSQVDAIVVCSVEKTSHKVWLPPKGQLGDWLIDCTVEHVLKGPVETKSITVYFPYYGPRISEPDPIKIHNRYLLFLDDPNSLAREWKVGVGGTPYYILADPPIGGIIGFGAFEYGKTYEVWEDTNTQAGENLSTEDIVERVNKILNAAKPAL